MTTTIQVAGVTLKKAAFAYGSVAEETVHPSSHETNSEDVWTVVKVSFTARTAFSLHVCGCVCVRASDWREGE